MGFGLMFFGYFLAMPSFASFFFTMIPASVFLMIGCRKLARVNIPFYRAFFAACALLPLSATASVLRVIKVTEWLAPYFESATLAIWLVWHIFALTGIEWVAKETRLGKLHYKAFRNKIFSCLYLIPATLLTISAVFGDKIPAGGQAFYRGLYIAIFIVGFIVILLNLLLIYSAYARICMPEDVNMPQKPSRFEFVNRRRAAADQLEAENAARLKEARERKQAERDKKRQEKKKKRK